MKSGRTRTADGSTGLPPRPQQQNCADCTDQPDCCPPRGGVARSSQETAGQRAGRMCSVLPILARLGTHSYNQDRGAACQSQAGLNMLNFPPTTAVCCYMY